MSSRIELEANKDNTEKVKEALYYKKLHDNLILQQLAKKEKLQNKENEEKIIIEKRAEKQSIKKQEVEQPITPLS